MVEESGEVLVSIGLDPAPQTLRYAQGDMVKATFAAKPPYTNERFLDSPSG